MRFQAEERVPELAAVLSVVSLALVFGAALGVLPVRSLPRAEWLIALVPHLNAVISVVAVVVIAGGWWAIRQGDVRRHRRAMVTGFVLFAAFLALYLYKVALEGPKGFSGPGWVETVVYYTVLALHVVLAVVCVPLLFYVLLLALTRPVAEIPLTNHPRFGRVTAALWLVSFVLGSVVYLLLYVLF
jgi:putative membrane protein